MSVRPYAVKIPFRVAVGESPIDGGWVEDFMPAMVGQVCKEIYDLEEIANCVKYDNKDIDEVMKDFSDLKTAVVRGDPLLFELAPGVASTLLHNGKLSGVEDTHGHEIYLNGKKTGVILACEGEYSHVMHTEWSLASESRDALVEVLDAMGVDHKHIHEDVAVIFAI